MVDRGPLSTSDSEPQRAVSKRGYASDIVRIAFGLIWLIDAGLKWQPGFRHDYMSLLMGESAGQPTWLHWWFRFWIDLQHPDPNLWAYLAAVVETGIAIALILGFARKVTYLGAILFSLLIWSTAEGFGGPYTGHSTDVGTAIVYALVFGALLALDYEHGPSRLSVDRLLERRFSWWPMVAEVAPRETGS